MAADDVAAEKTVSTIHTGVFKVLDSNLTNKDIVVFSLTEEEPDPVFLEYVLKNMPPPESLTFTKAPGQNSPWKVNCDEKLRSAIVTWFEKNRGRVIPLLKKRESNGTATLSPGVLKSIEFPAHRMSYWRVVHSLYVTVAGKVYVGIPAMTYLETKKTISGEVPRKVMAIKA
jgi:hypothetical protein